MIFAEEDFLDVNKALETSILIFPFGVHSGLKPLDFGIVSKDRCKYVQLVKAPIL